MTDSDGAKNDNVSFWDFVNDPDGEFTERAVIRTVIWLKRRGMPPDAIAKSLFLAALHAIDDLHEDIESRYGLLSDFEHQIVSRRKRLEAAIKSVKASDP